MAATTATNGNTMKIRMWKNSSGLSDRAKINVRDTPGKDRSIHVLLSGSKKPKIEPAVKKKISSMNKARRYSNAVPLSANNGAIIRKKPRNTPTITAKVWIAIFLHMTYELSNDIY